ncbi:MAG: family 78 glycoside hydrolase catalytic domain [Flavisolibacter sp.]
MKKILFLFFAFILINKEAISQLQVRSLLTENLTDPISINETSPRFSWKLVSDKRNLMQTAYEIRVATDLNALSNNKNLTWASGKISSDSSVQLVYKGATLQSGKKYFWQVRAWDNLGDVSPWSPVATWQMGLLNEDNPIAIGWKAKWIEAGFVEDTMQRPAVLFRKEFKTTKKIKTATAYITSHGMYEASINGKRVGDGYLTPGWTSYNKRLQYQAYDVTSLLSPSSNVLAVTIGNGWYRGYLAWDNNKNIWGKDIALLVQLDIEYSDGTKESILSDGSWKSSTGSIVGSEIYNGEIIDARREKFGWYNAGYDDAGWSKVNEKNYSKSILTSTQNELVKKHETFNPVNILTTPQGDKVIDFGQNLVGWVVVKAKGNAGDTIRISHAEVLDKNGNFYTENLRAAKAEAVYILKGGAEETFEPHFTFFGFRYIRIEGYPGDIKPENFTAVALYSAMPVTGSFSCSNALLNQLQHNIQWGQKGNFLDVPTDCPQRDERLGWTGDAQVFSRTAAYNMNVNNFFAKWLKDVAADQMQNGSIPWVIPNVLGANGGSTGWADVATIIPWNMYQLYGDRRILENQYNSMKSWVEFMRSNSTNDLWNKGFHFGDWLFYRPFDDNSGTAAVTDKYLIAQSFYAYSTQLLINAAKVLGRNDDVENYSALLKKIKDAYLKEYTTPNGRLVSGTQTAYVLALNFDLLPEAMRAPTAERLVDNIKSYGMQLTTGFLGTPYLCHVLSRFGYDSIAYKLLLRETYPSWLYPVKMGATTIWERWDGIKPDGSFEVPSMNSFNHYAYGSIGDWMYRVIAGINPDAESPGYKKMILKPRPGGGITTTTASLETYYGKIVSDWKLENGTFNWNVEIPPNTTATIYIPASNADAVLESGNKLGIQKDLKIVGADNGYVLVHAGSGKYKFVVKK